MLNKIIYYQVIEMSGIADGIAKVLGYGLLFAAIIFFVAIIVQSLGLFVGWVISWVPLLNTTLVSGFHVLGFSLVQVADLPAIGGLFGFLVALSVEQDIITQKKIS
jgi:hypothetical protein